MLTDIGGNDGNLRVKFTDEGVKALRYGEQLVDRRLLFEPRPMLALKDSTTYESMCMLHDKGFRWEPLPASQEERRGLSYAVSSGDPAIWYSAGSNVPVRYSDRWRTSQND